MPQEHLHNPHDRFFKQTFGNLDAAGAFFREFLPPALARRLQWTDLKRIDGSFIDQTLRERHADLLFSVPWDGRNLIPASREQGS